MIVAVIGGIGAGKSTVLEILEKDFSMRILRADEIAKSFYHLGTPVFQKLLDLFGEDILNQSKDGFDSKVFASHMFGNPDIISKVNEIVHPAVWDEIEKEIKRARLLGENMAVETALPSSEFLKSCDECWYIYAEKEVRIKRLMASRGYTEEEAKERISSQREDVEFRHLASFILNNSNSKEETRNEIYQHCKRIQR